ncbi:hypothetical protein H5395_05360 [Paracoccus sp. MC1854]|uniref:hypothetical protein n=1 Tax=Paracoccus sp. MC1854 TaxID=2760306 RepID=UPI001604625A|nr:hypothetical protein [Paracoccus sp. MC1854]MBB1490963.1 hypothetical protein [Paracoccus sp. MC1854]
MSYGPAEVAGVLGDRFARFYHDEIAPFWPPERVHVENGYRDLPFPFPRPVVPQREIAAEWPLSGLLGYVRSWSAARACGTESAVTAFNDDALAMLPPGALVLIRFPLTAIAGRVA